MIPFSKGHGLGNDYLVIRSGDLPGPLSAEQVRRICDRHVGVGSDGILLLTEPWTGADFGVRIFNPDGTEAEKSGNGLRILAKYIRDSGLSSSDLFTIDTKGGRVECVCHDAGGAVRSVTVEMGRCTFQAAAIPTTGPDREVVDEQLDLGDETVRITSLSVGNPHCVVFADVLDESYARRVGPLIETHVRFPERTNVQFAHVLSRSSIEIKIWERGAGWTLASGSSSCAAAAAAVKLGLCAAGSVGVHMPGGRLDVDVRTDWSIRLHGPVEQVFTGQLPLAFFD
jgi:diaminopimelate epimerase